MQELKFEQLSLFDDNSEEIIPKDQSLKKHIYSNFYNFSKVNELIEFLLKLEFKDNFKQCEDLSLLLELAFEDLAKDISSIDDMPEMLLELAQNPQMLDSIKAVDSITDTNSIILRQLYSLFSD